MKNEMLMNYFEIMNDDNNPLSKYFKYIYVNTYYRCERNETYDHLKYIYDLLTKLQKENRLNEISIELLEHILSLNDRKAWQSVIMLDIYLNPESYFDTLGDEYYMQFREYVKTYLDKFYIRFIQNPFINIFSLVRDYNYELRNSLFLQIVFSQIIGFYWLHHDKYDYKILVNIADYIFNNTESFYNHCVLNGFYDKKYYVSSLKNKEMIFIESLFNNGDYYGKRR